MPNSTSKKQTKCPSSCQPSNPQTSDNLSVENINLGCFCTTLDREQLDKILKSDDLTRDILQTQPQLFSNTSVFISSHQINQIKAIVQSIERIVHLTAFQTMVLNNTDVTSILGKRKNENQENPGVFMGYDFHLTDTGPQLIEINTNAGGAFLNSALLNAQTLCCQNAESSFPLDGPSINEQFMAMFLNEWRYKKSDLPLKRVAIVDENPQQQFLYPEFEMAKRLFERNGIEVVIVDPLDFIYENNSLSVNGDVIDLVYNRLTDFSFSHTASAALRAAYLNNAVIVTPNPLHHALYANKRNLTLLSDADTLKQLGVGPTDINTVTKAIPLTRIITSLNAEQLWAERKHLFFKPTTCFGSRATYRGDKLTKRVWNEILNGDYVVQQVVKPSERGVIVDGQETALKMDIRAYVYEGKIQLFTARLYQGQTTNFRTNGGGFASVFIANL